MSTFLASFLERITFFDDNNKGAGPGVKETGILEGTQGNQWQLVQCILNTTDETPEFFSK